MVKKRKTVFFCEECGYENAQWLGKCPQCDNWNTFKEMTVAPAAKGRPARKAKEVADSVRTLSSVELSDKDRLSLGSSELDRVFGGGVVPRTVILFAGEPGIGKSTLLLQTCEEVAKGTSQKVLYVTAEESAEQIRQRSIRLGVAGDDIYVIAETDLDVIIETIKNVKPGLVILDSIQAVSDGAVPSAPGTVTQVREVSSRLGTMAKESGFVLFLIGHVTKDGNLAGPRTLEHMVDVVVYFEGDRYQSLRMVRSVKNRYGSTGEVGIFDMRADGLHQIKNPSSIFLPDEKELSPGRVTTATMEGRRPFMVEVQALTNKTSFNNPLRRAVGVEVNKVSLLLAVIERSLGVELSGFDVFVKAVGGLRLREASCDLALILAVISSYMNRGLSAEVIFVGEVGLGGELRKVQMIEERVKEAERLGFTEIVVPKNSVPKRQISKSKLDVREFGRLEEVYKAYF